MLSHVDKSNHPTMVDVGKKETTHRTACARAVIIFPEDLIEADKDPLLTKKGPVIDTAIVAGVLAAKKTHHLIPFCHPIPIEDCSIKIEWNAKKELEVLCSVRATHKTGVEMEALTGASVAALTVYDMCKSLSHEIQIQKVVLVSKTGGKTDFLELEKL
ncbi:MAG: cyclic pyranopterin monophosphate synthase MoaC [Rhodospirillaceae bacterium]|mgnify:CR=1 FL=1|nr:cyclic pyranopterin monophosphate synthase MoaC [Rhodospirillaceae bacterium]|tara:strand:- start:3190 stop:3666 length:477 start_codon:yes stop_codon:yes gene_type:complete